jgi:hypothetical protein
LGADLVWRSLGSEKYTVVTQYNDEKSEDGNE